MEVNPTDSQIYEIIGRLYVGNTILAHANEQLEKKIAEVEPSNAGGSN